MEIYSSLYP